MKFDFKTRLKNVWMWIGIVGVLFASVNIPMESLTSWPILMDAIMGILMNPFQLVLIVGALVGVLINPTTPGLSDAELGGEMID